MASVLNTVQIMLFKYIYSYVAQFLNERENHRTNTEFEDSMISKTVIFTFFNSYISFFYIAFVAGSQNVVSATGDDDAKGTDQCGVEGCMAMLSENLLIVLLISLTSDKFVEFVVPLLSPSFIWSLLTCKKEGKKESGLEKLEDVLKPEDLEAVLKQYRLETYGFAERLSEYTTLFTMFGNSVKIFKIVIIYIFLTSFSPIPDYIRLHCHVFACSAMCVVHR